MLKRISIQAERRNWIGVWGGCIIVGESAAVGCFESTLWRKKIAKLCKDKPAETLKNRNRYFLTWSNDSILIAKVQKITDRRSMFLFSCLAYDWSKSNINCLCVCVSIRMRVHQLTAQSNLSMHLCGRNQLENIIVSHKNKYTYKCQF